MKVAAFVDQIERQYDVAILEQRGRVAVLGLDRLPHHVRLAIAAARPEVTAFLRDKTDAALRTARGQGELRALGLVRVMTATGAEWTHPEGDDVMEALLVGLLDPDAAAEAYEAHQEQFRRRGWLPTPLTTLELKPGRRPGSFTFTIERGKRYRPLPIDL